MTVSASSQLNCGRIRNFNVVGQKRLATYDLTATAGFFETIANVNYFAIGFLVDGLKVEGLNLLVGTDSTDGVFTGVALGVSTGFATGDCTGLVSTGFATGDCTGLVSTGFATGDCTGLVSTGFATGDCTGLVSTGFALGVSTDGVFTGAAGAATGFTTGAANTSSPYA